MDGNYTLSDIVAAVGGNRNNGGFGNNDLFDLLVLFALFGNGGWGGFGGGFGNGGGAGFQGYATRADINEGFALNGITNGITAIQQGLCDSTYALNNSINGGFHSMERQLADCCCTTQRGIDNVNYNGAINTSNIIQAQERGTQKILDAICGNRMADMQAQINNLQLQAALCGVVRYPNAITYGAGPSPFFGGCCNTCNI